MTAEILAPLLAFAFVASMTPGPNNLMLMASGVNHGFRRTLPHMAGVAIGFVVMLLLVGLGLIRVFDAYPVVYPLLKWGSVAYLLFLAWKIANASLPKGDQPGAAAGRPFSFLQAAMFQWINPKGWTSGLSAITLYAASRDVAAILWVAGVFALVSLPSVTLWTLIGQQMRRILSNPVRLRAFNWGMAGLLVASLYPVVVTR